LVRLKRHYALFQAPHLRKVHEIQRQKTNEKCRNDQRGQFGIKAKATP
jgi:hypothetical protein